MEGYSRINYSGVVLSRVDREDVREPVHIKEHTLLYVRSGKAEVVFEGKRTPLAAGDCVFLRKDHRVVVEAWAPEDGGVPFRSIALFFCRKFLVSYYRTLSREALPLDARPMTDAVLKIPAGPELESLFLSLTPYLDSADALPQETAFQKRREGLRCVLATDRDFYASLFDFVQPWKIDLPGFMEENYLYDDNQYLVKVEVVDRGAVLLTPGDLGGCPEPGAKSTRVVVCCFPVGVSCQAVLDGHASAHAAQGTPFRVNASADPVPSPKSTPSIA